MKYIKNWILNKFPNVTVRTNESGSSYININGILDIRTSGHFSPLAKSCIDIEIVSSMNDDNFAVRYDSGLSFMIYNRQEVKNCIRFLYDYMSSKKLKKDANDKIMERAINELRQKYKDILPVTKYMAEKYPSLLTITDGKSYQKEMTKFDFYNCLTKDFKEVVKNAFNSGFRNEYLIDFIIRLHNIKELNAAKNLLKEMRSYLNICQEDTKKKMTEERIEKVIKEAS